MKEKGKLFVSQPLEPAKENYFSWDPILAAGSSSILTRGYTVNLPMLLFLSLVSCRVTALYCRFMKEIPSPAVRKRTSHRLTLDLWLAKDNRFLNPKSSYERFRRHLHVGSSFFLLPRISLSSYRRGIRIQTRRLRSIWRDSPVEQQLVSQKQELWEPSKEEPAARIGSQEK